MRPDKLSMVVVLALGLLGCPGKIVEPPDAGSGGGTGGGGATGGGAGGGGGGAEVDAGFARSAHASLRFKGNERLTYDFAVGLGLDVLDVCQELGQYQCTFVVHPVALGGVDPYGRGLFEAPSVTGATTAVVVERVALAACSRRVTLDLATPASAVIFKALAVSGGKLSAPQGPEVRLAINELAQRAWQRDPTDAEVALLVQLNTDIEATGVAEPAKAWMQAACFAAFSSAESVFY